MPIEDDAAPLAFISSQREEVLELEPDLIGTMKEQKLDYISCSDGEEQDEPTEESSNMLTLISTAQHTTSDEISHNALQMMAPPSTDGLLQLAQQDPTAFFTHSMQSLNALLIANLDSQQRERQLLDNYHRKDKEAALSEAARQLDKTEAARLTLEEKLKHREEMEQLRIDLAVSRALLEDRKQLALPSSSPPPQQQQLALAPKRLPLTRHTDLDTTFEKEHQKSLKAKPKKTTSKKRSAPDVEQNALTVWQPPLNTDEIKERLWEMGEDEARHIEEINSHEVFQSHHYLRAISHRSATNLLNPLATAHFLFKTAYRKLMLELVQPKPKNTNAWRINANDQLLLEPEAMPLMRDYVIKLHCNLNCKDNLQFNDVDQFESHLTHMIRNNQYAIVSHTLEQNRLNVSNLLLHYWMLAQARRINESQARMGSELNTTYAQIRVISQHRYGYAAEILERFYPQMSAGSGTCITPAFLFTAELIGSGIGVSQPCSFCRFATPCYNPQNQLTPTHQLKTCDVLCQLSNNEWDILSIVNDCIEDPDYAAFAANDFIKKLGPTSFLRLATEEEQKKGLFFKDKLGRKLRINMPILMKMRENAWNSYKTRLEKINRCFYDFDLTPLDGLPNCFQLAVGDNGRGNLFKILLDTQGGNYNATTLGKDSPRRRDFSDEGRKENIHFLIPQPQPENTNTPTRLPAPLNANNNNDAAISYDNSNFFTESVTTKSVFIFFFRPSFA